MSQQPVMPRVLRVNIPEVATKVLKARQSNGKRIFTVSSNWLPLFGFDADAQVVEEVIAPNKGFRVRLAQRGDSKTKKVYMREYNSRSANPLKQGAKRIEQLIETSSQRLIEVAMGQAEFAHISFRQGEITFVPITHEERTVLQSLSDDERINTLVGMTGGVDCSVLEASGFKVDCIIEYRPNERRDTTDYTELTALSALTACAPKVLCNEDIYTLNPQRLAALMGSTPLTVGHFSLQCDDYSTAKNKKAKQQSVDDTSSTLDMFIPVLGVIDALKLPVVVIENVQGFMGGKDNPNPINDVFKLQLMRRGFTVHQDVFMATDFGGLTTRKRMYMVASALNAPFAFPQPEVNYRNVWNDVILPNWAEIAQHDITDLKVTQDAIKSGWARVISEDKQFSPTLMKAQGQDTKDAVMIERNNRYYRVPVSVQKALNGISESFDLDWTPKDKAAQIIGQSICCSLHHAIMSSVSKHIRHFANTMKPTVAKLKAIPKRCVIKDLRAWA